MAAAIYHGKGSTAFFSINGGQAFTAFTTVRSWSCTLTTAAADTTGMAAATGRTRIAGLHSGTATVECVYDATTYIQVDEADNALYAAGSTGVELDLIRFLGTGGNADGGYNGGAMVTSVDISVAMDDTPTVTYNFEWVGAVTTTVENAGA